MLHTKFTAHAIYSLSSKVPPGVDRKPTHTAPREFGWEASAFIAEKAELSVSPVAGEGGWV